MRLTAASAQIALRKHATAEKAAFLPKFFKTGPGEYGEGDVFIGVVVPDIRATAMEFRSLPSTEIIKLLKSETHEDRLLGLILLTYRYERGTLEERKRVFALYLKHRDRINNWDLVDLSAPNIFGAHLAEFPSERKWFDKLSASSRMWDRRIAIVGSHHFIRNEDFSLTLKFCAGALEDREDLMHKACGWMLREVGKRDVDTLRRFLDRHADHMPRTMLRYAIERFDETERKRYLARGTKTKPRQKPAPKPISNRAVRRRPSSGL